MSEDPNQLDFSQDSLKGFSGRDPIQSLQIPPNISKTILQNLLFTASNERNGTTYSETISHGAWTQEEDAALIQAIAQIGDNKWTDISKIIRTRSSKQCRERWTNCLRPGLKREPFEPWEDEIIISKQRELGNRWAAIARCLNGRSSGAVKNRWYAGLRSHVEAQQSNQTSTLPNTPLLNSGSNMPNLNMSGIMNSGLPEIPSISIIEIPSVQGDIHEISSLNSDIQSFNNDLYKSAMNPFPKLE